MSDTNTPPGRHVADILIVLRDALHRIDTRRAWEKPRRFGEWRRTGLGQRERQDGTGWAMSVMTMQIIIWRRLDGRWAGWVGEPGDQPHPDDDGFTLTLATVHPYSMTDANAKEAAARELRMSLVGKAAAYLRDAAIIDEKTREHQL